VCDCDSGGGLQTLQRSGGAGYSGRAVAG
jgi:hypothetical protein